MCGICDKILQYRVIRHDCFDDAFLSVFWSVGLILMQRITSIHQIPHIAPTQENIAQKRNFSFQTLVLVRYILKNMSWQKMVGASWHTVFFMSYEALYYLIHSLRYIVSVQLSLWIRTFKYIWQLYQLIYCLCNYRYSTYHCALCCLIHVDRCTTEAYYTRNFSLQGMRVQLNNMQMTVFMCHKIC